MRIGRPAVSVSEAHRRVLFTATIESGTTAELVLRLPTAGHVVRERHLADAAVSACLVPCMALGVDLIVDGVVSERLADRVPDIQRELQTMFPNLLSVGFESAGVVPRSPHTCGTALFLSGGVDGLHLLVSEADQIDRLIFVSGFEPALDRAARSRVGLDNVSWVAARYGKPLTVVHTNLRHAMGPLIGAAQRGRRWATYHGSVLASVAHALQAMISRVLIASSHYSDDEWPWGTHPRLDPLWSTEALEFEHLGVRPRFDKMRAIAERDPELIHHLRVCEMITCPDSQLNCCACEKCLRTMVSLELLDVLGRARSFPNPLERSSFAKLRLRAKQRGFYEDLREEAERRGRRDVGRLVHSALSEPSRLSRLSGRVRARLKRARGDPSVDLD